MSTETSARTYQCPASMIHLVVVSFAVALQCLANAVLAADTATSTSTGKLAIDRAWAEDVGGYRCSYALVTWENISTKTFDVVTIQAIALDSSGQKINENQRSFFAWERGPIGPGFKGTLKIPVEIGSAKFKSMECSVIVAK